MRKKQMETLVLINSCNLHSQVLTYITFITFIFFKLSSTFVLDLITTTFIPSLFERIKASKHYVKIFELMLQTFGLSLLFMIIKVM